MTGTEHIPIEMARAYLLGALDDEQAEAVEVRYFTGRPCLNEVKAAERRLINDYLDGALSGDELRRFKARYLGTPVLRKVVEQARRERAGGNGRGWGRLVWVLAASCVVAAGVWFVWVRREPAPRIAVVGKAPVLIAAVTLHLSPGVSKGEGAGTARMALPPANAPVRLIAELPGLRAPAECAARLSAVGADGTWSRVWNAPPADSATSGGGQELTVELKPGTLHPGDYVLEALMPDGRVRETYLFHVSPAE